MRAVLVPIGLVAILLVPSQASAQSADPVRITIDATRFDVFTGANVTFNTTVTNTGASSSGPMLIFLSIVNLGQGAPMDLEDWTSKRAESPASIAPSASIQQTWSLRAVQQGDYAVQVLAIRNSTSASSSGVLASPTISLHVTQRTSLDPGGVLPVVLGVPAALAVVMGIVVTSRRRSTSATKGGT